MDKIKNLRKQLEAEIAVLKSQISDFEEMLRWDSDGDPELEADLALFKREKEILDSYLSQLSKIDYKIIRQEVYAQDASKLMPNQEHVELKKGIASYINGVKDNITRNIVIEQASIEKAEALLDGIGVPVERQGKIVGYIIDKMEKEGTNYIASLLPYGKQVVQVVKLFTSKKPPQAPDFPALAKAALMERLLDEMKGEYEYAIQLQNYLVDWAQDIYSDSNIKTQEKIITMRSMTEWLVNEQLSEKSVDGFKDMVNIIKLKSIIELFTTAKVTITQVCEADEFGTMDRDKVYRTKFSEIEDDNRNILAGLLDCGLKVSVSVISTDQLKEYFPNCPIKYTPKIMKPLDEQIQENYHKESPGSTYAKARARYLKRQAEEREAKRKKLEQLKNKKYISVY